MGNRRRLAGEEVDGAGSDVGELSGVCAVLKKAEMRPEEDRCRLTSRRSLAAGGAAWSEGNDVRGGVQSALSGGRFGERTPSR
jgi:hypothetical protein